MNARYRWAAALTAVTALATSGGCNNRTIPEGRVVVEDNSPLPNAKGAKPAAKPAVKTAANTAARPTQATPAKPAAAPRLGTYVSPSTVKSQPAAKAVKPAQAALPPGDND